MAFVLQLLHASDLESGIPALTDAVNFSRVVNALRDDYANTLILSSGDNYIPGPFFSAGSDVTLRKTTSSTTPGDNYTLREGVGRVDIELINQIGFQAAAFGNHEFDLGESTVVSLIRADRQYRGTTFPYLSANLTFTDPNPAADPNPLPDGSTEFVLEDSVVADAQPPRPNSIAKSVVFTVGGEQIGVVGATTPTLRAISSPGNNTTIAPATFGTNPTPAELDALAAEIQRSVDALTNTGINKVILLAHMQQLNIERELAKRLRNVDVVIAGGSHTVLNDSTDRLRPGDQSGGTYPIVETSPTGQVLVVNTGANWTYVGRLVLEFTDTGAIDTTKLNPAINGAYATDQASVDALVATNPAEADPEVVALTNALRTVITQKDGSLFGKTTVFLNGTRNDVRTQETNLGNLTADANLFAARQRDTSTVISLKNGGGIRDNIGTVRAAAGSTNPDDFDRLPPPANPLANKQEGQVSQLDIENSLRFNNGLTLVTVTAEQLKIIMEHGVTGVGSGRTPGAFPQVGGVSFSFDATQPAQVLTAGQVTTPGQRIRSLALADEQGNFTDVIVQNGQIVGDPNRTFRLVTLSFLADGGDGYPFRTFIQSNPALANRVDLTAAATAPRTGRAQFAADFSEQDAFAEFLAQLGQDFVTTDVAPERDRRIQNLDARADGVFNILLTGTVQNDRLFGRFGDDDLNGLAGNDRLVGRAGDDLLDGGAGNDTAVGSLGEDTLLGGLGNNTIFGGAGEDVFVIQRGQGFNFIADFQDGTDKLGLSGNVRLGQLTFTQRGRNTVISFGRDELAILKGVEVSEINGRDFVRYRAAV